MSLRGEHGRADDSQESRLNDPAKMWAMHWQHSLSEGASFFSAGTLICDEVKALVLAGVCFTDIKDFW